MWLANNSTLVTFHTLAATIEAKPIKANEKICKSCNSAIVNGKLPKLTSPLHICRNKKLFYVVELAFLEEILGAPRITFAQIRQLGYKKSQIRLIDTIINVHSNLNKVQSSLPRSIDDCMTIGIMLKRKIE